MPIIQKVVLPLAVDMEVRQRAHREGRTISDTLFRAIEKGFASSPSVEMPAAICDKAERGANGKAVAAYLSQPLAAGVQRLAAEQGRSTAWVLRDLIRSELRNRGLLPKPAESPVDAALEVAV
jgi:Ribbon-helix-helix protein, copG family